MWNISFHHMRDFAGNHSSYVQNPVVSLRSNRTSYKTVSLIMKKRKIHLSNGLLRNAEN